MGSEPWGGHLHLHVHFHLTNREHLGCLFCSFSQEVLNEVAPGGVSHELLLRDLPVPVRVDRLHDLLHAGQHHLGEEEEEGEEEEAGQRKKAYRLGSDRARGRARLGARVGTGLSMSIGI